jgi:hypothetical protein
MHGIYTYPEHTPNIDVAVGLIRIRRFSSSRTVVSFTTKEATRKTSIDVKKYNHLQGIDVFCSVTPGTPGPADPTAGVWLKTRPSARSSLAGLKGNKNTLKTLQYQLLTGSSTWLVKYTKCHLSE